LIDGIHIDAMIFTKISGPF